MPWCMLCSNHFDLKRPSKTQVQFCSGRCRARASRERRARRIRERLERAVAAIQEARELLAVRPRGRRRKDAGLTPEDFS